MKMRNLVSYAAIGVGLIGVGERLMSGSTLEGPKGHTEVFYLSVNNYESGIKEDDRLGDGFLLLSVAGVTSVIASRLRQTGELAE